MSDEIIKPAKKPKDKKTKEKKVKKKAKHKIKKVKYEDSVFSKLSPIHQLFVRAYIDNGGKATRAYLSVYPNVSRYETAAISATRLMKKSDIKQAITDIYKRIWAEKDSELEKSKTYKAIHSIGDSDISDVVDLEGGTLVVKDLSEIPAEARGAIQSIEYDEKQSKYGLSKNIKVKLHPKLQALELRAKIQKMITDKVEIEGDIIIKPARRPDGEDDEEKSQQESV
jgi:hypothetical protein